MYEQVSREKKKDKRKEAGSYTGEMNMPVVQRAIKVKGNTKIKEHKKYVIKRIDQKGIYKDIEAMGVSGNQLGWYDYVTKEVERLLEGEEITLTVASYKQLADEIVYRIWFDNKLQSSAALNQEIKPFKKEKPDGIGLENEEVHDEIRKSYKRTSLVREEKGLGEFKTDSGGHAFHLGEDDKLYTFVGGGKHLAQAGSYKNLVMGVTKGKKAKEFAAEVNRLLLDKNKNLSETANVNKMYALIIGVEGAARSMHNIFNAAAFFSSYDTLQAEEPEASLFQLMKKYLSFAGKGGAGKSKRYEENKEQLHMAARFLEANGVDTMDSKAVEEFMTGVVRKIVDDANVEVIIKAKKGAKGEK